MESLDEVNAVRFHDLEFSTQGTTLFSKQSKLLFVSKKDIVQITLKYGFQSERPITEIIFGVCITGAVLYFISNFLLQIVNNQKVYFSPFLSIAFLPLGIWFIIDGFRKRFYFEVVLDNDLRKFPLRKNPDKKELQKFINIAVQLGYVIDKTILDQEL